MNCYSCPGAIGACPLGALQDSLAASNKRAPFYILGILALFGLIFARTICGFLCAVGLGQELLYKIKTPKVKKSRYTRIASYFKYVLLVVMVIAIPLIYHGIPAFCKYICPAGTFGGALPLLSNTSNNDLYSALGYLFSWKFILMCVIIVCCIFFYRFFCRFICPLGAIYGFFNKIALLGVKLDKSKCVDCGMCIGKCKMDIKHVGDHECINCGECIPVCPTKAISWKGSQIFIKDTTQDEEKAGEVTEKAPSLAALAASGTTNTANTVNPAKGNVGGNATVTVVVPEKETESDKQDEVAKTVKRVKSRGFWLQVGAWVLAGIVLVGALVYYNFIDNSAQATSSDTSYQVGEVLPDFTLETVYKTLATVDENGEQVVTSFNLADCKGKVTILNFWYTECTPCKKELPHFSEVKDEYGDEINMIIIHSNDGTTAPYMVQDCIDENGWDSSYMLFTHDTSEANVFYQITNSASFPTTVILDANGVITFKQSGETTKATLISEIEKAKNN
jgi:thiol-disulfide isomerase/thioredoxin/Fe-S-cluster-containing hydrogenase component 2